MTQVRFFIVGAPKCGTTAWHAYLSQHPDIGFAREKEPHYFCTDFPGFRWARTPEQYGALFEGVRDRKVLAEASVAYLYSKEAAANIRAHNPEAKILILLRPQDKFLPSYHNQLLLNRDEDEQDFTKVWRWSLAKVSRPLPRHCREKAFLDYEAMGRFAEQVERYLDAFGHDRVKVMWQEDWVKKPRTAYLEILAFLGLPDDGRTEFPRVNAAARWRSHRLADLTQRPPGWILKLSRAARLMLGRERLGLADKLRSFNRTGGYQNEVLESNLYSEISQHYKEDNARVRALLSTERTPG